MKLNTLSDDEISPQKSVQSLNNTIWSTWVPYEKAPNSVAGVSVVLLYTNETTGRMFDRTFWAYRDVDRSGESVYAYAFSNISDNLVNCYVTQWTNYSTPQLGNLLYKINVTAMMLPVYTKNNFFVYPFPWTTADGNSYWTFFHMRAFHVRDMWVDVGAWDVSANWLGMLQSALTPGAEFVAFDSRGYVTAATTAAELQRRSQCRAAIVNGQTAADCILSSARSYPIAEIRDVYTALHQPIWDDVTAGTIEPTAVEVHINGQRYLTITATLFSEDLLRVIVVWYQPWAVVQGSSLGLTSLICSLALLSTFVLTVLGVFGVLRPLMAVGRAMRAVARTLKQGEDEAEAVVEPRNPSVFREVDEIGKDFETIVVDFLGFSSTNARNNKCAPRDSCKPFAVAFTDVQSSTGLWGKDPVEMSRCMQVHHELIRGLIKEHGLYEVKTIGDSFMVTTTSAQEALHFALDIQTTFYEYEWDWEEADEYYQETTLAFTKSGSAESEYNKLWNGLRIRIGIHYGTGDVTYDEVSKGYDYYGTVVNTAARIEAVAHGGQIIVSQDVMNALPDMLDPAIGNATKVGTYPLRGVVDPPVLVEVKPTRLQGRTYPPLRVEDCADETASDVLSCSWEGPIPETAGDQSTKKANGRASNISNFSGPSEQRVALIAEECARSHSLVRSGVMPLQTVTHQLQTLYHILEDLLKPLGPQQQSVVTKALAKGWGVAPPKSKAESYATGMHLVQRMSETTKVLSHIALRPSAAQRCIKHGEGMDFVDVV
eukprot:EG_transcript_1259